MSQSSKKEYFLIRNRNGPGSVWGVVSPSPKPISKPFPETGPIPIGDLIGGPRRVPDPHREPDKAKITVTRTVPEPYPKPNPK